MFQIARTFTFPFRAPRLTLWVTTAGGGWFLPSKKAIRGEPTKDSYDLVRCRAVNVHVKGNVLCTFVGTQPLFSVSRTANRALPPLHLRRPLGPSTLCGSYWICPQFLTIPLAHWACRLVGALT